jgi:copper transport protein
VASLCLLALSVGAGSASAHTDLVSSHPAPDEQVDVLPHQVVLEFDEPMRVADDGLVLNAPGGRTHPTDVLVAGAGEVLVVVPMPDNPTPAGRWEVEYSAYALDGHLASGSVAFWVGAAGALMPTDDNSALLGSLALLLTLLAGGFAVIARMGVSEVSAR